jgi:hypothetical protein
MSSAKREQPTVLRWDDVVELVRRVTSRRRGASPFHSRRKAGQPELMPMWGPGQNANLVSHTSAAKLLGDLVSGVSAIAAPVQEWAAAHERPS